MPRKVAILGITGAGKSTLSRRIAEKTGLPLFHMDALFWKGKWEEVPEEEYLNGHAEILKNNDRWIIEGWVNDSMTDRLREADLVMYLDYSGVRVAWHYVMRWLQHRRVARPELPAESVDHFKWRRFFLSLLREERPAIEEAIRLAQAETKIVRLRSPQETETYLQNAFP